MKRYIISKYIKRTGHVIEGRGNTKAVAQKRFKAALAAFRKLMAQHSNDARSNSVIVSPDNHGNGKLWMRKSVVQAFLRRD